MLNRAALLLRYKEPALHWLNNIDEGASTINVEEANKDRIVYLISHETSDTPKQLEGWLKRNHLNLFESELEGWRADPSLWPKKLNWDLFNEWFEIECHTLIVDTVDGLIEDDGL